MNTNQISLLLADDDEDDRLIFQEIIEELSLNVAVECVENGVQLIHLLNKKKDTLPSILFLDINMPLKNGMECLKEIKQCRNLNNLPVVICSTSFNRETINQAYNLGAQYYLRKPSDFNTYKNVIETAINLITEKRITNPSREVFVLHI